MKLVTSQCIVELESSETVIHFESRYLEFGICQVDKKMAWLISYYKALSLITPIAISALEDTIISVVRSKLRIGSASHVRYFDQIL